MTVVFTDAEKLAVTEVCANAEFNAEVPEPNG
jgi:hypothetical protein